MLLFCSEKLAVGGKFLIRCILAFLGYTAVFSPADYGTLLSVKWKKISSTACDNLVYMGSPGEVFFCK